MAKFQKRFERSMKFERGGKFEKSGGGGRRFEEREPRGERFRSALVDAVCDKCGRECQLPFKPTGDRPVYCSSCFRKPEAEQRRTGGDGGSSGADLAEINKKLDRILKALELD